MPYRFLLMLLTVSALVYGCSSKPEKKRSSASDSESSNGESGSSGGASTGYDGRRVASRSPGILGNAIKTKIVVEIDMLSLALQAYKERRGFQDPPCLADVSIQNRKVRFMRHVQAAHANSTYGTAAGNYDRLAEGLKTGNNASFTLQPYNFKNKDGDLAPLDLNTLDQAESFVFWLGGFPTPYDTQTGVTIAQRKLFGFHRDADSPFKRDTLSQEGRNPTMYRTEPIFQFKDDQLVDQDYDGWLEYVPFKPEGDEVVAPFVYFDADTYAVTGTAQNIQFVGYPRAGDPGAEVLADKFGLAVPLAGYFDPMNTAPMRWQNAQSFQIISAGLDGRYSAPVSGDLLSAMRIPVYPKGDVYDKSSNYSEVSAYDDEELDNLTNLSKSTLGEERDK